MTISRSWLTICIYAVGLLAVTLLLIQHWVHIPAFLPYAIFLACPLMHLLMHRGHGRHHGDAPDGKPKPDERQVNG